MTPTLCRCGYRLTDAERLDGTDAVECPACARLYVYDPAGIDANGPHGDRLVPVEGDVGAG